MIWDIDFGDRDWHRWFAWYPVQLSFAERNRRAWLETIERKTENVQGYLCHRYRSIQAAGRSIARAPDQEP